MEYKNSVFICIFIVFQRNVCSHAVTTGLIVSQTEGLVRPISILSKIIKMPFWMKCWIDITERKNKGLSKPVQHFIQHHVFAMLDEMLKCFAQLKDL